MNSSNVETKEIIQAAFSDEARKKLWIPESVLTMPDRADCQAGERFFHSNPSLD